jgi:hypothetical protein
MMIPKVSVFILALSVSAISCKKDAQPIEPISGDLAGSSWQLLQIDTVNGGSLILDPADTIILSFNDQRCISGKSPGRCGNIYFGVYFISGRMLFVRTLSSPQRSTAGTVNTITSMVF